MEKNEFYWLLSKFRQSNIQAYPVFSEIKANEKQTDRKLIYGEYNSLEFPIIFRQAYGKNYQDILDTGYPSLFLISEKMKNILEINNLTGWKTYPIILYDKKGNEISGYHGFSVVGKAGPIDFSKSEIILKRLVETGPVCTYYKGVNIDIGEWDGSDFFCPKNTIGIYITKRCNDIIKKHKITNIQTENIADIETEEYIVKMKKNTEEK